MARLARGVCGAGLALALAGCTPQANLLLSLLPEGTFTTPLNNLRGVSEPNREKLTQLEKAGDWAGVVKLAQTNLERDPTNSDWHVIAGYANSQLKQYDRAGEHFREAIRISPDDITAWNLLAQAYRSQGQHQRALRTLDEALRVNRDSPMTYYLLGETFSDVGRPDRAVGFYAQAVQLDPKFADAVYRLGVTYARLGRKAEFAEVVKHLERLDPGAAKQLAATPIEAR